MKNKEEKQPVRLEPIADSVTFESRQGVIKMTFYTGRLDKTLLPDHMMKLSEVVMDNETAKQVATMLFQHANKGNAEVQIKKTPLPEGLRPKKN